MPNKKSSTAQPPSLSAPARTSLQDGRTNQKRRTYLALLDAALELTDAGQQPTLQDVATKAMVSRATAYRYFPSADALIREAFFGRAAVPFEDIVPPGTDPIEAIGRAAEVMNKLLLDDEQGVHIVVRAFMQTWLDSATEERLPRMGRRMNYINPILDSLGDQLDGAARERLRIALSMVLGTEAVIAMRDVAGASIEDSIAASVWAARALISQALAEVESKPARRKKEY